MGMFDTVVVLDDTLECPHGHRLEGFQTKSFSDPSMDTYLLEGPHVYLVAQRGLGGAEDNAAARWRLEGNEAVFQRRHAVEPIAPPREIVFYVLRRVRAGAGSLRSHAPMGDLVDERQLWVEFRATFDRNGLRHIERTSGTRDDLSMELRKEGLRVVRDDEPLAIAHREIRAAREALPSRRSPKRR